MSMQQQNPVPVATPLAVVGMDCILPGAPGLKEYWRLLRRGEDAIRDVPETHWRAEDYLADDAGAADHVCCARGGFLDPVQFNPLEFGIPPTILEATDTAQLLGLVSGKRALDAAGYTAQREFDRTRASVILGVTGALELVVPLGARLGHPHWRRALSKHGIDPAVADEVVREISDAYVGWQESSFPGLLGNVVAGRIANRLNLQGTNCVVDAACASSLSAIHLAALELENRRCDVALAGGVDTFNDIFMFMCFARTQALSHAGDARPFSADADGTVLGEGVGMVVLKRLEDAEREGDNILAVLRGVGAASDGKSQSIYAPLAAGQARALRNAYAVSGVDPKTVGMVEAHGTGTRVGDVVEHDALRTVFAEAGAAKRSCAVGSVKSQIGHAKAAAGAASLVKAILALRNRTRPGSIKITAPNPKLEDDAGPLYLAAQTQPWFAAAGAPRRAGVSSFGFGGSNFHAVVEEYPIAAREPAWDGSVEIIAFSADTVDELRDALRPWQERAATGLRDAQLAFDAAASRSAFVAERKHRLTLVWERGDDLHALLEAAERGLTAHDGEHAWQQGNVFYGGAAEPGELAFVFSGQGSQYVGMLGELACVFPEAHDAIAAASAVAVAEPALADVIYPPPTFEEDERRAQEARLRDTRVAQPALGAVSAAMFRVLKRFGIEPQVVAGHSFGELTALHAAGALDEESLHKLAAARGAAMAEASAAADEATGMLAVAAPLDEIEALIEAEELDVTLANRNAPKQGILAGSMAALKHAAEKLAARGWATKALDVSAAFHTRFMAAARARFEQALRDLPIHPPRVPAFANVTGEAYPSDVGEIRRLLAEQLTAPVRFADEIRNMYQAGVRTFVEVGPRRVLTGLVDNILGDKLHVAVATDASGNALRQSTLVDVARVVALVTVLGHAVDLHAWEGTPPEPIIQPMSVELVGANYRAPRAAQDNKPSVAAAEARRGEEVLNRSVNSETERTRSMQDTTRQFASGVSPPGGPHGNGQPPGPAAAPAPGYAPPAYAPPHWQQQSAVMQEGLRGLQQLQQYTAMAHQRFLEAQTYAQQAFQSLLQHHQQLQQYYASGQAGLAPAMMSPMPMPAPAAPPMMMPTQPMAMPGMIAGEVPTPIPIGANYPPPAAPAWPMPPAPQMPASVPHAAANYQAQQPAQPPPAAPPAPASHAPDAAPSPAAAPAPAPQAAPAAQAPATQAPEPAVARNAASAASAPESDASFEDVLLAVVAELTGYPVEMLELQMDLEADLGIDSIKRLEILSAVQKRMPHLKQVDSQYLGSLRTLQNIVDTMTDGDSPAKRNGDAVLAGKADAASKTTGRRVEAAVDAQAESLAKSPAVIDRQVLTTVALPPARADAPLQLAEGVLVVAAVRDDALADALVARLRAAGRAVQRVVFGAVAAADDVLRSAAGLVVFDAPRGETDKATPTAVLDALPRAASVAAVRDAFLCAQRAANALQLAANHGGAVFATVSRLDGRFGLEGAQFDPAGGGLAGLSKTAADEWSEVRCRAIDLDPDWTDHDAAADVLLHELAAEEPLEVGLSATGRVGLDLLATPVEETAAPLDAQDFVVVSGGARGVTAACALALARAHGCRLLLLGRSELGAAEPAWAAEFEDEQSLKRGALRHEFAGAKPKPADVNRFVRTLLGRRELRKNLAALEAAGAEVRYAAVDIRDGAAVAAVVDDARSAWGPLRGIVHGAGVIEDRLIESKPVDAFERVVGTKLDGLAALLASARDDELKFVALFSSVSGRFGRRGQVDYAIANEVLNKTAQLLTRSGVRASALNWGPWDGGMVTPALKREFERSGVGLIPLDLGADAFVDEISATTPTAEVVLGAALPHERRPRAATVREQVVWRRQVCADTHPILHDHTLHGRPVVPFALLLEWLAHSALQQQPGLRLAALRDVRLLRGVVLNDEAAHALEGTAGALRRAVDGWECAVAIRGADEPAPHMRATALLADALPAGPEQLVGNGAMERLPTARTIYDEILFHGPKLRVIDHLLRLNEYECTAALTGNAAPADWMDAPLRSQWILRPRELDAAFQLGLVWRHVRQGAIALPSSIAVLRCFAGGAVRHARLAIATADALALRGDLQLIDADGRVVVAAEGCEWIHDPRAEAVFAAPRTGH